MMVIIQNLKVGLDEDSPFFIRKTAAKKLGIPIDAILQLRIVKESVDARKKQEIKLVYSVKVELAPGKYNLKWSEDILPIREEAADQPVDRPSGERQKLRNRPVIVGTGPAGIFAAWILAQNGYRPIVLERGSDVDTREKKVTRFWKEAVLDPETNVQFGEGGAGTFSDGKLTTRIHDRRCEKVLETYHRFGADESILYKAKPHIGTDILKKVVKNMREAILDLGGEFHFNTRFNGLQIQSGILKGITADNGAQWDCEVLVLAIGHSSRDTYENLYSRGIIFEQKPFSIGVRIEHLQELIDRSQYGSFAGHPRLGRADYQLFYKTANRTAYSFCMCPGGLVVASASEPGTIVTNGMSEFARDKENANSALVVSVGPGDFEDTHPLSGISFQRKWEQAAYMSGGSNYAAPVQRLEDFFQSRKSRSFGAVKPSYTGKTEFVDLHDCLPSYATSLMKEAVVYFDNKIKGFSMQDAILTGVETRTSAPVRIPRDESLQTPSCSGVFPTGEGAGYAGGIVSAAVDGIRVAEKIIEKFKNF